MITTTTLAGALKEIARLTAEVKRLKDGMLSLQETCSTFHVERDDALARVAEREAEVERLTEESNATIRDLKTYIMQLRGKTNPEAWRGLDTLTADLALSAARVRVLEEALEAIGNLMGRAVDDSQNLLRAVNISRAALKERDDDLRARMKAQHDHLCKDFNAAKEMHTYLEGEVALQQEEAFLAKWLDACGYCRSVEGGEED